MDATGYSSFPLGAERLDEATLQQFAWNYKVARHLEQQLAQWIRDDRVRGVAEDPAHHKQELALPTIGEEQSHWKAIVSYGLPSFGSGKPAPGNKVLEGQALIVAVGPDEFLVTGTHCRIDFDPIGALSKRHRMWGKVEEGKYQDGRWSGTRIWNGDQTDYGLNFGETPLWLKVRLRTF